MEFASANPSVVRAIKQRILLNAWLRMPRNPDGLPALVDFQPEEIADELTDMMGFTSREQETVRAFLLRKKARG